MAYPYTSSALSRKFRAVINRRQGANHGRAGMHFEMAGRSLISFSQQGFCVEMGKIELLS